VGLERRLVAELTKLDRAQALHNINYSITSFLVTHACNTSRLSNTSFFKQKNGRGASRNGPDARTGLVYKELNCDWQHSNGSPRPVWSKRQRPVRLAASARLPLQNGISAPGPHREKEQSDVALATGVGPVILQLQNPQGTLECYLR
jgi:hypothetical protein